MTSMFLALRQSGRRIGRAMRGGLPSVHVPLSTAAVGTFIPSLGQSVTSSSTRIYHRNLGKGARCYSSNPSTENVEDKEYEHIKAQIEAAVQEHAVLVFMKGNKDAPMCGFSKAVVQVMNEHGVDYKTVNVLASEAVRSAIKRFTEWPTIPQVFVKGDFIGGCDIVLDMHRSGELKRLFEQHRLLSAEEDVPTIKP